MNHAVMQWAVRHHLSHAAIYELQTIFGMHGDHSMPANAKGVSEAVVQSVIRLEAARKNVRLFRNNVGALTDDRGVPIRYGLANDSKQLNETIKSGDLVGWRVGTGQFVSRECKPVGWHYTGTAREQAQLNWLQLVVAGGGDAAFCTGEGTL